MVAQRQSRCRLQGKCICSLAPHTRAMGVFSCEIVSASGIPMAGVVIYMGVG